MKIFFKNKKVLIVLGIVLALAIVAGAAFIALPATAQSNYLKSYKKSGNTVKSTPLTSEEIEQINKNAIVTDQNEPFNEDDQYWLDKIDEQWDAVYQNELDTLEILEREYGSIEEWAPESEFDLRLERTVPRVLKLLNSNKLSDKDRATLREFMQILRDEGKLSPDVEF